MSPIFRLLILCITQVLTQTQYRHISAEQACNLSSKMPSVAMVTASLCEGNSMKLWRFGEGNFMLDQ